MTSRQAMSAASTATDATPIFDPRYNSLLLNFTYLRMGGAPGSRDVTLKVTNGEGEVWLDPAQTPTIGTLTQGRLVIASETFPRYAPLTMTLTGADLLFHVRQGRLLTFGLLNQDDILLRLLCTRPLAAAYRYELRGLSNQLILSRFNKADNDRETQLEINVIKAANPAIVGMPGGNRREQSGGKVLADRLVVRRAPDGELRLRLHGARMEWDFFNGVMIALRVFDSRGIIGVFSVLDLAAGGVSTTVSFLDTLP